MSKELLTLPVLAGAYKGRRDEQMLTHLGESSGIASCGKAVYLADAYAHTPDERRARPTCPRCAKRWDKLHAADQKGGLTPIPRRERLIAVGGWVRIPKIADIP